jgi:hypothetical protein
MQAAAPIRARRPFLSFKEGVENTRREQAVQKCSDARRARTEERVVSFNTSSDEV